ncbi:RNA 3'-terminal phosphate cyclase [Candidatus Nitrosotalea okcheonensis]|uniref:RNA 3'-terminal phosphate cyclase n=1 Tax=Candidatus Nitrosotalea okcheonensis TaxID=1903276 RepID=A0A2H1FGW7_9ARCH|nr:RNA 3'-terminal phosphate cyclase [Candidatus Nitrosotalea okcheonensis]SMH72008.1 RNA 3'-phosphate cyclase [Candidatus Nitrosotalea okcheonensis]
MEPIKIDGGWGEGGGQIIRSAVTLSAITGKPVEIENIRKNRKVPGLRPQHLLGIKILSKICQARVEGLYVNSTSLKFSPSQGLDLDLQEDIGTAGSIPLVLQVLIPAVSLMKNNLRLSIVGGTDVPWSPTSDYTKHVFYEALSRIGINFTLDIKKRGYYPKGGGLVETQIQPCKSINPISLLERSTASAKLLCSYSHIPKEIVEKEVYDVKDILAENEFDCEIMIKENNAIDRGCSMLIFSYDVNSITGSDSIYQKGLQGLGESIAKRFVESNLGVDLHLSDMLVVPLALVKETSAYRVKQITKHLETNLFVASKMTGCRYGIGKLDNGFEVRISGVSYT